MHIFEVLTQDETWLTGEGDQLQISEMDWRHCANVLAYLRRRYSPAWWVMRVDIVEATEEMGGPEYLALMQVLRYGSVEELPVYKAITARLEEAEPPEEEPITPGIPKRLEPLIFRVWEPDGEPWAARALLDIDRADGYRFDSYRSGSPKMSPSKALGCMRAAYYQITDVPKEELSDRSRMAMVVGTAMHAHVERWPKVWAEMDPETRAKFAGSLMDRCPDGKVEQWLGPMLGGVPWSMFVDFFSEEGSVVVDYKSKGSFPAKKMYGGEVDINACFQLGIYGEAIEQVYGWYPRQGRVANWPKEPPSDWEIRSDRKIRDDFDVENGDDFLVDHPIRLTDEGFRTEVLALIDLAAKVWRMGIRDRFMAKLAAYEDAPATPLEVARDMHQRRGWYEENLLSGDKVFDTATGFDLAVRCLQEPGEVPRWWWGLPPNARVDPTARGRRGDGTIVWNDGANDLTEETWKCRFCDFRETCVEEWQAEIDGSTSVAQVAISK